MTLASATNIPKSIGGVTQLDAFLTHEKFYVVVFGWQMAFHVFMDGSWILLSRGSSSL